MQYRYEEEFIDPFTLFAVSITANAQKFALIDMEYILENIPAYERANEQLEQASRQWQSEVEKISEEAKTLYKNYQSQIASLSETQRGKRKKRLSLKRNQQPNCAANTSVREANCIKNVKV